MNKIMNKVQSGLTIIAMATIAQLSFAGPVTQCPTPPGGNGAYNVYMPLVTEAVFDPSGDKIQISGYIFLDGLMHSSNTSYAKATVITPAGLSLEQMLSCLQNARTAINGNWKTNFLSQLSQGHVGDSQYMKFYGNMTASLPQGSSTCIMRANDPVFFCHLLRNND